MTGSSEDYNRIQKKYSRILIIKSIAAHSIQQSLESARRGSLNDLTELANFWQEAPNLLTMGILDVFFAHLDATKAPDTHNPAPDASALASRAFISLLGLSKAGSFIGGDSKCAAAIIKSWPGIFYFNWICRSKYSVQDYRDIQVVFLLFCRPCHACCSKA